MKIDEETGEIRTETYREMMEDVGMEGKYDELAGIIGNDEFGFEMTTDVMIRCSQAGMSEDEAFAFLLIEAGFDLLNQCGHDAVGSEAYHRIDGMLLNEELGKER